MKAQKVKKPCHLLSKLHICGSLSLESKICNFFKKRLTGDFGGFRGLSAL